MERRDFKKEDFRKKLLSLGISGEEMYYSQIETLEDVLFCVSFNLSSTNQSHNKIRDKIKKMVDTYINNQKEQLQKLEKELDESSSNKNSDNGVKIK